VRAQCTGAPPIEALTVVERKERRAVLAFGHWLGGTRDELRTRFGQPVSARGSSARYFNAEPVDSAFEWRYTPFTVSVVKNGVSGGELASHVTVTGSIPNAPASIQVGVVDTAGVRRLLGAGSGFSFRGDTLSICVPLTGDGDAEEDVRLDFIAGRLIRATWGFYVG